MEIEKGVMMMMMMMMMVVVSLTSAALACGTQILQVSSSYPGR
jgi:hypothetical protein